MQEYEKSFIENGYLKLESAFSNKLANDARNYLDRLLPFDVNDPDNWQHPVINLPYQKGGPFASIMNSNKLIDAIDMILGRDSWVKRDGMGNFPIRFPCGEPEDSNWHVDSGFPSPRWDGKGLPDFDRFRANIFSDGRGLLLLILLSDIGKFDAPTCIRKGSHIEVAKKLYPEGVNGLRMSELSTCGQKKELDFAVGDAGTVYLCHPFLVHRGQQHYGKSPRYISQPGILPKNRINFVQDSQYCSLLERSIQSAVF